MRIVCTIWFLTCLYISIPGSAFAQEEQQRINLESVLKLCGAINLPIIELLIPIAELDIVKQQMDISKEALKLTTEALQQSIDRQKLGTAKPFEVFQTQEFYLLARIDSLNAVISYNKAQFQLKIANGQNL